MEVEAIGSVVVVIRSGSRLVDIDDVVCYALVKLYWLNRDVRDVGTVAADQTLHSALYAQTSEDTNSYAVPYTSSGLRTLQELSGVPACSIQPNIDKFESIQKLDRLPSKTNYNIV